ncbi:MAG: MerR family transcriptional regulator, partial [Mycobacterium sp.]
MEMRVEQLSQSSGESVDTIRYYQSKGLLEPPRRQGRVAWYHDGHLERLARIRSLQQRGFTL